MAHKNVIATKTGRYGTRMLTAGDLLTLPGPAARAMIALGRAEEPPKRSVRISPPPAPAAVSEVAMLRDEYEAKFGKRPFNGWDADMLREKIAAG